MTRLSFLSLCAPCLLAAVLGAQTPRNERPRVCVLDFPVASGAYEGWAGWGYGGGRASISGSLQDLMTTSLISEGTGRIRLMERERLDRIVAEQKLGASGMVDETTAASLGKLLGVRYMITGKVTRFAYKKSGFGTGWGVTALASRIAPSLGAGAAVAGDVHVSKASFTGRLDVRLVDVQTSEVMAALHEEGEIKDTSVKVAGTGSDVQFDQELVSRIFEPIVEKLAKQLVTRIMVAQAQDGDDK
jgi:curli biogenesis system outer membrane secretion channel CsgG